MMKAITLLLALPALAILPSCSTLQAWAPQQGSRGYLTAFRQSTPDQKTLMAHEKGYWDGDGVQGPASIRIDRSEQRAFFYRGDKIVGMSPIATGKSTHTTPAGKFKITQKNQDHKSSLYGVIRNKATGQIVNHDADTRKHRAGPGEVFENAPMPYFMRFNGAIGMHVGHLPGYAASHGCVRMPEHMAVKFFENASLGTPVVVE